MAKANRKSIDITLTLIGAVVAVVMFAGGWLALFAMGAFVGGLGQAISTVSASYQCPLSVAVSA